MKPAQPQFMERQLTEGSVGSHLIKMSVPMLCNIFMVVAFNLTDTYFVAQLGTNELAAMSFTFPVVTALASVATGLGGGTASVIAIAIGQGARDRVQQVTSDSLTLSVLIGTAITLIALLTVKPLFQGLGAGIEVLPLVQTYMEIWYPGVIFLLAYVTANDVIRATGNVKILTALVLIATVINVVLDPLLIFGWGIFPRLEIAGAALATVIAQVVGFMIALMFLQREQLIHLRLSLFQKSSQSWQAILGIGLPLALIHLVRPLSVGLITSMIAAYGADAIAGFGIASRVEALALITFMALSASLGPIVGQNWGAGKYDRVKRAFSFGLRFCIIWGLFSAIAFYIATPSLASLFANKPEIIAIVATYMAIVPISYAAVGMILIASSTFAALGRPLPAVVLTIVNMLILYVPLAELGSRLFGLNGIFAANCGVNVIVGLSAIVWNRRTLKLMATGKLAPISGIS